jgi:hypothetical protein
VQFDLGGHVGRYLEAVSEHWLKTVPLANPGILEMFRDRDRRPPRRLVPWAGEFPGKYLTAAVQNLRVTGDSGLRAVLSRFVADLVALQDEDGYLGPWPRDCHLTNRAPNADLEDGLSWDTWGHYNVMLGLLLWHEETGDADALRCARGIADMICERYLEPDGPSLAETGSTEMNLAPVHALCLLHRRTGVGRYLEMARRVVDTEFQATDPKGAPLAGDYLRQGLAATPFHRTPKPRWESLHPIMALAEMWYIEGREDCRQAFQNLWWSMLEGDRHNNGGFTSGEQAVGNPYAQEAIETCCTIAWIACCVEMLRLTGNPLVADELELSTLNSVLGLHSPSGRWATYNTPMDGVRRASTQDIAFQAREGTPELNCCSVNAARGLGMISDWVLTADEEGLVLNYYGPGSMTAELSGGRVSFTQDTAYPREGRVRLEVGVEGSGDFVLRLRIPYWSRETSVERDGSPVAEVRPGSYLRLPGPWQDGEVVEIALDLSLHAWVGERECSGKASLYRGPVLLTYDRRLNELDPDELPELDLRDLSVELVPADRWPGPMLAVDVRTPGGPLRLCDFASAGLGGSPYRSWLTASGLEPTPFAPDNPLRSAPLPK